MPDQTKFSLICKSTNKFYEIEEIIYKKYEQYRDTENCSLVNGKRINRFQDLESNSIKDGDVIVMDQVINE